MGRAHRRFCHTTLMLSIEFELPFKPIVLDGPFAVFIFFVLSGYVLSVFAFRAGRRRDAVDLALRRYPRLVTPIFCICTVALFFMAISLMRNAETGKVVGSEWLSSFYSFPGSIMDMLTFSFWWVFAGGPGNNYNSSLWTMPFEMQGSMLIFAMLLIVGRSDKARLVGHAVFLGVTCWLSSYIFAMAVGVALANFVQCGLHQRLKSSTLGWWCSWFLFAVGIGSAAVRPDAYGLIWTSLSGAAILYAVLLNSTLQRWLSSPLSRWMGKISFSLYLVHILVICCFSSWLYLWLSEGTQLGNSGVTAVALATVAVSLLSAAAFYRVELMGILAGRSVSRTVLDWKPKRPVMKHLASIAGRLGK
jgi:peptidoglycan/LPS O-acetylase OafA/YrhL